jgi:putative ABC transport system permease protein
MDQESIMPPLWQCALREVRRRWGRTLLTALGIALGVAVFVSAVTAARSARRAYRDLFEHVSGPAALEIVAPDQSGFDDSFAPPLASMPGVRAVLPRIVTTTALNAPSGSVHTLILGMDSADGLASSGIEVTEGEPFTDGPGLWLEARQASAHGLHVGTTATLWTPSGLKRLPIRGLIESHGPLGLGGPAVACLPLGEAGKLFRLSGRVNSVQVCLAEDADPEALRQRVSAELPAGLIVRSPGERATTAEATFQAAEQGLQALACIALVTAAFVVLNTFLLSLGERRRRLALLHVLGATQGEIRRTLLIEAALLGVVGGLLGLAGGLALTRGLSVLFGRWWGVSLPTSSPPWPLAAGALLAGPVLAVVAARVALWQAGRFSPLEALRPMLPPSARGLPTRRILLGAALVLAAALLVASLGSGAAARLLIGPGVAVLLAGTALVLPLATRSVLTCLRHGTYRLRPEWEMAAHQLGRRPGRTDLTAGVFFVAVAAAVAFAHSLANTLDDLRHWSTRTFVADFFIRGSHPDGGFLLMAALPESLGDDLSAVEGVEHVERLSFLPAQANDRPVLVLARTFAPGKPLPLDLQEGEPAAVREQLHAGDVVVGTALARKLNLGVGDTVTLDTAEGPQPLRIAGTVNEYSVGGQVLYLEWEAARRLLPLPGAHVFLITARAGAPIEARLQAYCEGQGLLLQSNADMRGFIDRLLGRVAAIVWALIVLTFLLAALGIVNTLAMNVLEQDRDLGILRALGMTRGQVSRSILYQGGMLAVLSALPGAVAGIGLAWLLNGACGRLSGRQPAFTVHPGQVAGCVGLALAAGLLTALFPARRLARAV